MAHRRVRSAVRQGAWEPLNPLEGEEQRYRLIVAAAAVVAGVVAISLLTLALGMPTPGSGEIDMAALLLDRASSRYPLTIQNLMWLLFFFGLGELWVRFHRGIGESAQLRKDLLPEDDSTMLRGRDLVPIYRNATSASDARFYRLQRLIIRTVQQFQISNSVDQANGLLNSSLDLMQHEIDLKYNMLRYLVWLIPTLGFIGTVVGIALALSAAGELPDLDSAPAVQAWFGAMTSKLGIAFSTTLVALLMSALLVFMLHIAQGKEETALNSAGQYCLDNLVNRLYEEP